MPRIRRQRADSTAAIVEAIAEATLPPLEPPKHVKITASAKPFWYAIIDCRPRKEWSGPELAVAAHLAQCQADIERETEALSKEQTIITSRRQTTMNPRVRVLEQYARREMALMRTLRLGGRVSGSARDDAKRQQRLKDSASKARAALEEGEEDLLA